MVRIAILDLYDGVANQGMRCIREILDNYEYENDVSIEVVEFDVRRKNEVPDLSFDAYISTGGPGSPLTTSREPWDIKYMAWFDAVQAYNANTANKNKKHTFLICHSFQLICRHLNLAKVCRRKSTSFGIFPIHLTPHGVEEPVFEHLFNPFFAVDSRDFQVIEPNIPRMRELGCEILCLEKSRPHVPLERALMAIRFNKYTIGTQFHPEADALGMSVYFKQEDKKAAVIEAHGEEKWLSMIDHLNDPEKILYTHAHVLPNFLNMAVGRLLETELT